MITCLLYAIIVWGEIMSEVGALQTSRSDTPNIPPLQPNSQVCLRHPSAATISRTVDIVYTDIFLDNFNYVRDSDFLWNDILNMNNDGDERRVLVVLTQDVYDIVRRNENGIVLHNGRCFITTTATFDNIGDDQNPPPPMFDALVYFNTDPFPQTMTPTNTVSSVAVRTPFAIAFDHYISSPDERVTLTVVFNSFFLRTQRITEYERSHNTRIRFNSRLFPVHSYEPNIVSATACNFCSDAVLCMENMEVYTIRSDQQIPSLRALGPVVAQTMFQPNRLVLLEMSAADRGGRMSASEYYRFKKFYYSFAHGKGNKWGFKLTPDDTLHTYLQRWNTLLREEMKRWFWILSRQAEDLPPHARPSDEELQRNVMQMYAMCPCILTGINVSRDVCGGQGAIQAPVQPTTSTTTAPTVAAVAGPSSSTAGGATVVGNYIRDVLMPIYDTTTFIPGGDLSDKTVLDTLRTKEISINNELVVRNIWPYIETRHDRFFTAMIE